MPTKPGMERARRVMDAVDRWLHVSGTAGPNFSVPDSYTPGQPSRARAGDQREDLVREIAAEIDKWVPEPDAAAGPEMDANLRAERVMDLIDRHLTEWKLDYVPATASNSRRLRGSLVVELAAEFAQWAWAYPGAVTVVPDHEGHGEDDYCGGQCPRGMAVGRLLADKSLVPFLNAARNQLSEAEKRVRPGDVWAARATLELPRWQIAALYGLLSGTEPSAWPDWLASVTDELRTTIER